MTVFESEDTVRDLEALAAKTLKKAMAAAQGAKKALRLPLVPKCVVDADAAELALVPPPDDPYSKSQK